MDEICYYNQSYLTMLSQAVGISWNFIVHPLLLLLFLVLYLALCFCFSSSKDSSGQCPDDELVLLRSLPGIFPIRLSGRKSPHRRQRPPRRANGRTTPSLFIKSQGHLRESIFSFWNLLFTLRWKRMKRDQKENQLSTINSSHLINFSVSKSPGHKSPSCTRQEGPHCTKIFVDDWSK